MATVALSVVGTAIGGPVGGAIGAFIGGIIDQQFLFPAIFGRPEIGSIEGPRLESLSAQNASEGVPLNYCIGSRVRVGGNVIWMTDLEEVTVSSGGGGGGKGGGGGGGGGSTTYEYYVSAMIAICEGEIDGIVKVFADGKTFVQEADPGTMSTAGTATINDTVKFEHNLPNNYYGPIQIYQTGGGDSWLTDLGFIGSGEVTITGYSDSDLNTTFAVKNKRVKITGDESLTLIMPDGLTASDLSTLEESVTITQEINRFPANVDRLTLYPGASNDAIDTLVEGDIGEDETPRFKNVAKMLVERLSLADYGNRLPTFNFVVNRTDPTTVRDAITDIMTRGGFSGGDFDVTGIDVSYEIEGYSIAGSKSIAAILEPIMLVWDLGVYEDNGVLTFYERGDEPTLSDVRTGDWTAHVFGENPDDSGLLSETPSFDLPSEVSLTYPDGGGTDEVGEARARRIDFVSDITEGLHVPIVMSAGKARAVVELRLWRTWDNIRKAAFKLPPRYLRSTEGDIVPISIGSETYNVRLTRITWGANWLLDCEGTVLGNTDFDFTEDGLDIIDDDGGVAQPGNLLLFIFNAPPLSDDQVSDPGFYWCFAVQSYDAAFTGGSLYRSTTTIDGTYSSVASSTEATLIATEDQLGSVDNSNIFDGKNTLDVEVINGTLSSVNEIDLLNGANQIMLANGEIIAFQNATDIGTNLYRLSKLLRGRRGTERFIGTHPAEGEIGVALNDAGVNFESHNLASVDLTRYFKAVTPGQAVEDIDGEAFTYGACTIKPFSVVNIEATRDGSNNVSLSWDRRTRSVYPLITATIPLPLVDGVEEYEIDLYDPTGTTVEQTFTGLSSPVATITDAEVVAAGYISGDPIIVKVYQISPSIGRGVEKEATV